MEEQCLRGWVLGEFSGMGRIGLCPPHLHGGVSSSHFVPLVLGKERRENAETETDEPASQPFLGFLSPEWGCSAPNYWAPNQFWSPCVSLGLNALPQSKLELSFYPVPPGLLNSPPPAMGLVAAGQTTTYGHCLTPLFGEALWDRLGVCKPHASSASGSLAGSALGRPGGDKKAGGGGSWASLLPGLLLVLSSSLQGWCFGAAAEVSSGF